MTRTFKVLSALLSYPTAAVAGRHARAARQPLTGKRCCRAAVRRQLARLTGEIATGDLYDLQERYVLLFDRTRSLSLHLFEHVHGESRDRGQAMIDLKSLYENGGLEIERGGIAGFRAAVPGVPLDATASPTAYELLGQPAHIFAALAERLRKREVALRGGISRRSSRLRRRSPRPKPCRPCSQSPIPMRTISRRSMPPGRTSRSTSVRTPAPGCKDGLIARVRAGLRPAPGVAGVTPARVPHR